MKGCFFSLVFYMRTNAVLSAVCGYMDMWARECVHWTKRFHLDSPSFKVALRLDCVPQLDMRCCTHAFASRNMTPFCSGAACRYFPMIAQQKVPAGTDKFISRCKCKGGGGSIGMVIHWSPPLDFADKGKTLPFRLECSPVPWVECRQIHLDCWTVSCVAQKPFTSLVTKWCLRQVAKKKLEKSKELRVQGLLLVAWRWP